MNTFASFHVALFPIIAIKSPTFNAHIRRIESFVALNYVHFSDVSTRRLP